MNSLLLFDLHQIFFANLMVPHKGVTLDENLFRHLVLNSIRANRVKFKEYKEVVIATDSRSWRKDVFLHYKANRKKDPNGPFDWKVIYESLDKIREELKEYFPYRVINAQGAEADDIIGWVCRNHKDRDIMIISGDKDFLQLQRFRGVKQYDPVRKKLLSTDDPQQFLYEHILRGDSGDGIPNVLSDGDTFVSVDKRQVPLTKKKIRELVDVENLPGFVRNKQLIDLTETPESVNIEIEQEWNSQEGKTRSKMFGYFVQKRLSNLMSDIQDF